MTSEEQKEEEQPAAAAENTEGDEGSLESLGEDGNAAAEADDAEDHVSEAPILELSSANLEAPSGHTTRDVEDGASSHNSGLTEESSLSEYEEDLFPEDNDGEVDKEGDEEEEQDQSASRGSREGYGSSLSGNSMPSSRSLGGTSLHSVNVSAAVWARAWEERVKDFQKAHKDEYQELERKRKQKDILKIENERSQRIFENKIFQNVDRVFKILGGAFCALFCCTIIIIIILAAIVTFDTEAPPAPTVPPLGSITTVPPRLRAPSVAPVAAMEPTAAPVIFAGGNGTSTTTSNSTTVDASS